MSCYAKHPDIQGIECWHGPGHTGDHGKESRAWPNLDDPREKELRLLRAVADAARVFVDDLAEVPAGGRTAMDALYAALKAVGR